MLTGLFVCWLDYLLACRCASTVVCLQSCFLANVFVCFLACLFVSCFIFLPDFVCLFVFCLVCWLTHLFCWLACCHACFLVNVLFGCWLLCSLAVLLPGLFVILLACLLRTAIFVSWPVCWFTCLCLDVIGCLQAYCLSRPLACLCYSLLLCLQTCSLHLRNIPLCLLVDWLG